MKKREELFFKGLMIISSVIISGSFLMVVFSILKKGLPAMNLDMLIKTPQGGYYIGKGGGVLNAIMGSVYIAIGSSFLALIISLPIVLYINSYLHKKSKLALMTRFCQDVLVGIPSIVYGVFGFTLLMYFGLKASLFGGICAVTLLVIPIMVRTMDEVLRGIPKELSEAAFSLGASRLELSVLLVKQGLPGIVTAVLLSFGRAIGDAASVLFTAGFSDNIPAGLESPVATLPLAILFQLSSPLEEVQSRSYASAFILTCIVVVISIIARILSKRFSKNRI